MSTHESAGDGADLVGISKVIATLPEQALVTSTEVATSTLRDLLAPVRAVGKGVADLIDGRFARMAAVQQVETAGIIRDTYEKVRRSGKNARTTVQPRVIVSVLENAGLQNDKALNSLWSNLLTNELLEGGVHPEIPNILSRLTADDAKLLAAIARDTKNITFRVLTQNASREPLSSEIVPRGYKTRLVGPSRPTLSHSVLEAVGLIERQGEDWPLTVLGEAFLEAVKDPPDSRLSCCHGS